MAVWLHISILKQLIQLGQLLDISFLREKLILLNRLFKPRQDEALVLVGRLLLFSYLWDRDLFLKGLTVLPADIS